jgi:hypothetical protein
MDHGRVNVRGPVDCAESQMSAPPRHFKVRRTGVSSCYGPFIAIDIDGGKTWAELFGPNREYLATLLTEALFKKQSGS